MKVYPVYKKEDLSKIEMLLKATSKRNYILWLIGSGTGFRVSDIVGLKVKDVKGTAITLTEKKTKKQRTVKISKKLKAALKDYIKDMKDEAYLFPSRVGGGNRAISIRRVQQIIKMIGEKIGIEKNINSHSMRKTYAYWLYKKSGMLTIVQEALNHSKESITIKYLCLHDILIDSLTDTLYE